MKNADVTELVSQLGIADDIFSAGETHKSRQYKGVFSRRLGHLGRIITTSLVRHFKNVHLNFHRFSVKITLSSVETYHLFKRKKLVKNHEYRIKYFKVHVLNDKQTIQKFVSFEKRLSQA